MSNTKTWNPYTKTAPYGIRQFDYQPKTKSSGRSKKWLSGYEVRVPRSIGRPPEHQCLIEWFGENHPETVENFQTIDGLRPFSRHHVPEATWRVRFVSFVDATHFWLRFSGGVD